MPFTRESAGRHGAKGGRSASKAKQAQARANGKKGGRPRKRRPPSRELISDSKFARVQKGVEARLQGKSYGMCRECGDYRYFTKDVCETCGYIRCCLKCGALRSSFMDECVLCGTPYPS